MARGRKQRELTADEKETLAFSEKAQPILAMFNFSGGRQSPEFLAAAEAYLAEYEAFQKRRRAARKQKKAGQDEHTPDTHDINAPETNEKQC